MPSQNFANQSSTNKNQTLLSTGSFSPGDMSPDGGGNLWYRVADLDTTAFHSLLILTKIPQTLASTYTAGIHLGGNILGTTGNDSCSFTLDTWTVGLSFDEGNIQGLLFNGTNYMSLTNFASGNGDIPFTPYSNSGAKNNFVVNPRVKQISFLPDSTDVLFRIINTVPLSTTVIFSIWGYSF